MQSAMTVHKVNKYNTGVLIEGHQTINLHLARDVQAVGLPANVRS